VIRGLAKSLGSLTGSPIDTALSQAHRMARRHLEAGGAAVGSGGRDGGHDFPVPLDVDPAAVAAEIKAKLRGGLDRRTGHSEHALDILGTDADGRIAVRREQIERLGEGDFERGRRVLDRVINDIRRLRVLMAARRAVAVRR
jgi:hypothetical protein